MALKSGGSAFFSSSMKAVRRRPSFAVPLPPNLWMSEQSSHGFGAVELVDQIRAARGAVNLLVDAEEHLLDLLVEFGAVGDDQHPRIRHVFSRIHLASQTIVRLLPEPWVCQMMPPSRRRMNSWAARRRNTGCGGRAS